MILDKVEIYVKAGNGGNGAVSFRREKYVSHGGPDGGDGGRGGNVILKIAKGESTLVAYKSRRKFVAANGGDGRGGKIHGKNGEDIVLYVPEGTVIKDKESGLVIIDMSNIDEFLLCKGGRGGWGNRHFSTPTRQIPRFAKSGTKGEERNVILELKMIADVGLIGLPNVGKSTLLSVISAAKPKIADYKFTTLSPNIGVVYPNSESSFIVADIPGLIEGASCGAGLGFDFLRHIERCRMFIHMVDVSDNNFSDPITDIETINNELCAYDIRLSERPQIIVANKIDSCTDENRLEIIKQYCLEKDYKFISVSAASHNNIDELISVVYNELNTLPPIIIYDSEIEQIVENVIDRNDHSVEIVVENGVYNVYGEWLFNLVGSVNFEDKDSLRYFQKILRKSGVIDKLREAGCTDGNSVAIYDFEFDFLE